jgi:hypothetical protein
MGRSAHLLIGLLLAATLLPAAACVKATPPPMPEIPNPQPGPGADALEVEHYQLEQEKRTLGAKYGPNIDRIKQINSRLIEINLELHQRGK